MNSKLAIVICLVALASCCAASDELLENLGAATLAEIQSDLKLVQSRPRQCGLYSENLATKLGNPPNEDDKRPLLQRVDLSLLTSAGEAVKGHNKDLSDYLKDCVTLLTLLREQKV